MKTVKKIFFTDLKNLSKNFFALVIAVGVCFLPALYAWFNIYSNWDPYGNTASLQMVAVCQDKGYTDEDGNYINVGQNIMDELAENDKVDWHFMDKKDDAIKGVESGDYYAAVVIDDDFTYNMYNIFLKTDVHPTLTFYQNQKKNPVATKISDTVIGTLQNNIDEEFIKVITKTVFAGANAVYDDVQQEGKVDKFIGELEELNEKLISYQELIGKIIAGNSVLTTTTEVAKGDVAELGKKAENSATSFSEATQSMEKSQVTLESYSRQVDTTMNEITDILTSMEEQLEKAQISNDIEQMEKASQAAIEDSQKLLTDLQALESSLTTSGSIDVPTSDEIKKVQETIKNIQNTLNAAKPVPEAKNGSKYVKHAEAEMAKNLEEAIGSIRTTQNDVINNLIPQVGDCITSMERVMKNTSQLMDQMSVMLSNMGNIFGSLQTTIVTANDSLEKTQEALGKISDRISEAVSKAKAATQSEQVKVLVNTLAGDPDLYGDFFSDPVEINSVAVYPVENYGSAVAPFYTVLSIWVGVIILAAIIKVKPNKEKYPNAGPKTLFFGRCLFFLFMGQLQTLITVLGNIYILKIQCLHPFLFWLSTAITSIVFTTLIFALVYSFGDIGKAIAVVVLVLQIAGSSGTYPIELLPAFFQKVYIFFPFPYAINAIRECICGLYELDLVWYLLQLCPFFLLALIIGLYLRIPFEGLNEYMEKRMEDTEMM